MSGENVSLWVSPPFPSTTEVKYKWKEDVGIVYKSRLKEEEEQSSSWFSGVAPLVAATPACRTGRGSGGGGVRRGGGIIPMREFYKRTKKRACSEQVTADCGAQLMTEKWSILKVRHKDQCRVQGRYKNSRTCG